MHAKTNRQNHDFQIAYFLAGSCHTPDAAYALLCDLRSDREDALKMCEAGRLREQAKRIRARKLKISDNEAEQLEGQAELMEIDAMSLTLSKNTAAAKAELAYINRCIEELQPQRKYGHLSDPEAFEACQREEWQLEFLRRAENAMLTVGTIPTEQLEVMRMHPDFTQKILPRLEQIKKTLSSPEGQKVLLNSSQTTVQLLPQKKE